MPYRVIVNGVPIEVDTSEEAIELARQVSGGEPPPTMRQREDRPGGNGGSTRWTDARVGDFFRKIKGQQTKVIEALLNSPDGRTDAQLLQLLNFKSGKELAGVMTGLVKNARAIGADPKDLYTRRAVTLGDERQHEYIISGAFRKAVNQFRSKGA
jgi:hypothetical protein